MREVDLLEAVTMWRDAIAEERREQAILDDLTERLSDQKRIAREATDFRLKWAKKVEAIAKGEKVTL